MDVPEVVLQLCRPPTYPKLLLFSRYMLQTGSSVVVLNIENEWTGIGKVLALVARIVCFPVLGAGENLIVFIGSWGVLLFLIILATAIAVVALRKAHFGHHLKPATIALLRTLLGFLGKC